MTNQEQYPYTSDWKVIRERILGPDYKQISGYKGCWSGKDEWLQCQAEKSMYK